MRDRKSLRDIHRLSWLIASENPETEPRVLPPQEDVLLLEVWNCEIKTTAIKTVSSLVSVDPHPYKKNSALACC